MTSHVETPLLGDSSKSRKDAGGDSAVKDNTNVKNNSISADESVRKRALKKVGLTSTAFIGPAFPPAKSNIEDTLSEFYKELGEIATDVCNPEKQEKNCVQSSVPRKTFTSRQMPDSNPDTMYRPSETDGFQRGSGQQSWPHWYQNEPYNQRRQRPGNDLKAGGATHTPNQRLYPQPLNRPPDPTFHRPPFPHPPLRNPRNLPPHGNPNWSHPSMMNQYHDHFPPFPRFPPPMNECSPHRFDRDERGYSHDAQVDNGRWSRNAQEEWDHLGEEYNGHERFDSGSELWERQHHCRSPNNTHAQHPSLVLILMRGLPGSGKSTMARELLSTGPSGLILSTDDYFAHDDGYCYEPGLLGTAHEWNQSRAKDAMHDGRSPVIIDNTNIEAWEMKPYVEMALESGYKVDFCEPNTSWKFDLKELEKRNKHGVPQEKIARMLDRFSFPISISIVMDSREPLHVHQRSLPEQPESRTNRFPFPRDLIAK